MDRLLFVGILLIGTAPLYAQGQQPNVAKLKADAQKVVSVISGDKAKTQAYCQIAKRQFGAIRTEPGNLCLCKTAWWG